MVTVLVVDDDPAIREIFTVYLELRGYEAIAVSGGAECLELLTTRTPDLILLDMMMEPMDGWETLRAIRNHPASGQIPVMIVTGKHPVPEDIVRNGGMIDGYIVKPVEFPKMAASLCSTIERDKDLCSLTAQKKEEGQDPALIAEYTCLLRLVRITHHLIRRFSDQPWADRTSLKKQEERLGWLHTRLGFPDHVLERDEGR
jgi:two-component system OmpR family response regulator